MPNHPRYTRAILPTRRFLPGSAAPGERPREREALSPGWCAEPERWRESEDYLYGCDLFNARFWWEAHEAWEVVWKQLLASGREHQAQGVQVLIQASAAMIKREIGNARGVETLVSRIEARLPGARGMGMDVCAWWPMARAYLSSSAAEYPEVVLGR